MTQPNVIGPPGDGQETQHQTKTPDSKALVHKPDQQRNEHSKNRKAIDGSRLARSKSRRDKSGTYAM